MPGTTPIFGDVLQIRVNCSAAEQLSQNVLHYKVFSVTGGGLTIKQIADQFAQTNGPIYRSWMASTATFDGCTVQNLTPPITDPATSSGGTGIGSSVGNLEPRQASGLLSHTTGFGGRANRGRSYIGLMAAGNVDASGNLTGGGVAILANVGAALGPFVALSVGGLQTILQLQIRHPDTPGPPPMPSTTAVTFIQASGKIATQRRRGDYGAPNL